MRKETISLLQNDFLAFARMALSKLDGTVIDDDRYVELYATYLMKFADWSINRLVVNMPPRHGKSKLGSVCCTAWILAHNPRAKIMIVTYSKDLAQNISRAIRDILESSVVQRCISNARPQNASKIEQFCNHSRGRSLRHVV